MPSEPAQMAEEAAAPAGGSSAQPQEQVIVDESLPMDLDEPEPEQDQEETQENVGEIPPDFLLLTQTQAQARSQGSKHIKAGRSSSAQRPDAIALCSPYRLDADQGGDHQFDDNVDGVAADDVARKNDLGIILQAIAEATDTNPELLVPPIPTLHSIHDTLQEVLSELGPIGCVEYLKQLVALKRNDKKFKTIKKKEEKGKGKGKEMDVDASEEKDRIFLNLFEMITDFLERVNQENNLQEGTCYKTKSEKMERLEVMLKWRRNVLTKKGEKFATALIVPNDTIGKILKILIIDTSPAALYSTGVTRAILGDEGDRIASISFPDEPVAILVAIEGVKWEMERSDVIHFSPFGFDIAAELPPRPDQPRHSFFVFANRNDIDHGIVLKNAYNLKRNICMDGESDDEEMTTSEDAEEEEAADAAMGSDDWGGKEEDEKEDGEMSNSGEEAQAGGSGSVGSGPDAAGDVAMVDGDQAQKNTSAESDDDVQFVSEGRAKSVEGEGNAKPEKGSGGRFTINEIGLPLHGLSPIHFKMHWVNPLPTGERALMLDEEKPKPGAAPLKAPTYKVALFTLEEELWCTASQAGGILRMIGREAFNDPKRLFPVLKSVEEIQEHLPALLTERQKKRNPKFTKGGKPKRKSPLGYLIRLPPLFGIGDLFIPCAADQPLAYDIACLNVVASLFFSGWMSDKREVRIDHISRFSTSQDPVPYIAPPGLKTVGRKIKRADFEALEQARPHAQSLDQVQAQAGPSRLPAVHGGQPQAEPALAQPFPAEVIQQLNNRGRRSSLSGAAVHDMIPQFQGVQPQPQGGLSRLRANNAAQRVNGASDPDEEKMTRTKRRKLATDVLTTEYVGKAPQFWETCLPTIPGTFSSVVCRIKSLGGADVGRTYRTICILTRQRLPLPVDRALPTTASITAVDARLQPGTSVTLKNTQLEMAHRYTMKLISTARDKPLESVVDKLPFLLLPLSHAWQRADLAANEVNQRDVVDVAANIGWIEMKSFVDGDTRKPTASEISLQHMNEFIQTAIISVGGDNLQNCYEVVAKAGSADEVQSAVTRLHKRPAPPSVAQLANEPVLRIRPIPPTHNPGKMRLPKTALEIEEKDLIVYPSQEAVATISRSVYHTIHMLPWLLWTIDALLLAQEVNHRHLNSAADEYDVLAALSTSNTRRTYNCEVLEFAGDIYWKLAASAYVYYFSPAEDAAELGRKRRAIDDNIPLRLGLKACGITECIQNREIVSSNYTPYNCGYATEEGDIKLPAKVVNLIADKPQADVSEALVGSVGNKGGNLEAIMRTCITLNSVAMPVPLAWAQLPAAESPSHGFPVARRELVDNLSKLIGYEFKDGTLPTLVYSGITAAKPSDAFDRVAFLGLAVYDFCVARYIVTQGNAASMDPGQLTRWRTPMNNWTATTAMAIVSRLAMGAGRATLLDGRVHRFKMELQKTIDAGTELDFGWRVISDIKSVGKLLHALMGAVLIDNNFDMTGPETVFRHICMPFITRFIGAFELARFAPLVAIDKAVKMIAKQFQCAQVKSEQRPADPKTNLFYAAIRIHGRTISESHSVYAEAAKKIAGRDGVQLVNQDEGKAKYAAYCTCPKAPKPSDPRTRLGPGGTGSATSGDKQQNGGMGGASGSKESPILLEEDDDDMSDDASIEIVSEQEEVARPKKGQKRKADQHEQE